MGESCCSRLRRVYTLPKQSFGHFLRHVQQASAHVFGATFDVFDLA
jgi:hypothetical protein